MSIDTLEKGKKYRFRERIGKDPITDLWDTRSLVFYGSAKEARTEHAKWLVAIHLEPVNAKHGTVRDALAYYLERQQRRDFSANYIENLERRARDIRVSLGDIPLKELKPDDIERFYYKIQTERSLSAMSIKHYHSMLGSVLRLAVQRGWMTTNPHSQAMRPKERKKNIYIPSANEVDLMLTTALSTQEFYVYSLFYLAVATWARRGELLALRWDDVNFKEHTIIINKAVAMNRDRQPELNEYLKTTTGSRKGDRVLDISEDIGTINLLHDYRRWQQDQARRFEVELVDNAFLFSFSVKGDKPCRPDSFTKAFARVRNKAGLSVGERGTQVSFHCLRHYGITQALMAGLSIAEVSYRAGHTDISTTMDTYGHHIPGRDRNAGRLMGALLSYQKALPKGEKS